MPEQLTDDERVLLQRIQRFVADELVPRNDESSATARPAIIAASKQAGFFTMTQPPEFGGTGASVLELCLLRDEIAAGNTRHGGAIFGPGPGVLGSCGEPLRTTHLMPLLAGDKRGAFGFTEADDSPHPTSAVRDGGDLIINGQKSYVSGGMDADFINTLVHVDGSPALVVIDTDTPGIEVDRAFHSLDGSHHVAYRFRDVRVPQDHLIGQPGQGLPIAMKQIGDTRLNFAATSVGLMRWVIDLLTDHLAQPDRSGSPRGAKDGVRMRYSECRINAYAARSMLYRTARLADSGANVVNESIACKHFATEHVGQIVDTAIQLVGGAALIEDHPLALLYRQVRSYRLAEGASDVLLLNLARGKLDLDKGRI